MYATSQSCVQESIARGALLCVEAGYGFNHIQAFACDVCMMTYRAVKNSAGYNACVECPPHHTTVDIGMSECAPCPRSQKRYSGERECTFCDVGISPP